MIESEIKLDNLLSAAVLLAGGGRLVSIEDGEGRKSTLTIDLNGLDSELLAAGFEAMAGDLRRGEACKKSWSWIYSRSVLGMIEVEYRRLKVLVSERRRG